MIRFSANEFDAAAEMVHRLVPPTPQRHWPLLSRRIGVETWVKHENHAPTGAFKVRGGITFIDWLKRSQPEVPGICTATRGNHGQSQALAARAAGLRPLVYVPEGNSVEKNAAMEAFGAELVVHGTDFDTAREEAFRVAQAEGLAMVPPFHPELVRGVGTYGWELFNALRDLDTVYVPIGCGSGICGTILARDALGLTTEIVGVVSTQAPCAKLTVEAGRPVETRSATTFADGIAVRVPVPEAVEIYREGAARIVTVTDEEVASAMRLLFECTHNVAEGAGAAALAALYHERVAIAGRKVGIVLSGGNVDTDVFRSVLSGETPTA
ncbi:threonine dehydratase [Tropicimonas sp. TH_r6]|uniref:threonine dehydratase n=1 Tax=Tropicimonas sp. TH_r6 TaxID=3082085 RepID=UPI002953DAFB|nr:threonine dehydratase [Tropicimonas sp. TH_r6]MDV7142838.1 threonine dehydratase [Tropicimonas sp. TH_r6]